MTSQLYPANLAPAPPAFPADRRQVILYYQLGCGRSERPDDLDLWTVDRFVEELATVRATLQLDRLHLFGSSWGGMLAMQCVLDRQPELASLTLCGSPASSLSTGTRPPSGVIAGQLPSG